jgi:hypothetical protein
MTFTVLSKWHKQITYLLLSQCVNLSITAFCEEKFFLFKTGNIEDQHWDHYFWTGIF